MPESEPSPPVLPYDAHHPARDVRSHFVIPAYCGGMLLAGIVFGLAELLFSKVGWLRSFDSWFEPLLRPFGMVFLCTLLAAFFLGLTVWLKVKLLGEVRFAAWPKALAWGFIAGILPLPFIEFSINRNDFLFFIVLIAMLIWHCLFSVIAGTFLCYRWHLRD